MLELLKRRGECSGENFDALGLLQTLCLVKMDSVDGVKPGGVAGKRDQVKTNAADSSGSPAAANAGAAANCCNSPSSATDNCSRMETEMKGEDGEVVFIYRILRRVKHSSCLAKFCLILCLI